MSAGRVGVTPPLTREQRRKVALIKAAFQKSHDSVEDHLISLRSLERGAIASTYGLHGASGRKITPEWPRTVEKLRDDLLRVRQRLDDLATGLRAERLFKAALREQAAAADAWADGLRSTDPGAIERELAAMKRHWARSAKLSAAAVRALERGR